MVEIGYARVFTRTQNTDRQIDQLTDAGCKDIFVDYYTGRCVERPHFQACLEVLDQGDTLIIVDLDRLGRSAVEAVRTADELRDCGVNLRILRLDVDTATPEGRLFYTVTAALAEFETDKLRERTRQGLDAARRRGRRGGRRPALDGHRADYARELVAQGESISRTAELLGVSRTAVRTAVAATESKS